MKASSESGECASLISTVCSPAFSVAGVAVMARRASFCILNRSAAARVERRLSPMKNRKGEYTQRWELARRKTGSRSMFAQRRLAQRSAGREAYGLGRRVARASGGLKVRDAFVYRGKRGKGSVRFGLVPVGDGKKVVGTSVGVAVFDG